MKKSAMKVALALAFGVTGFGAQAASIASGSVLNMTAGVINYGPQNCHTTSSGGSVCTTPVTSVTGSYFGMDTDASGSIADAEKTALSQGVQGLVIGTAQNKGGYNTYGGAPIAGDVGNINAPWAFFGNTGKNYTTVAVTGGTGTGATAGTGLNMSGWMVTWNGIDPINMGGGAWGTGFVNGKAKFNWDGVFGHTYTMNYAATVPHGDASGFGDVKYFLHLEGTVTAGPAAAAAADLGPAPTVPVPAAAWLLGSGLVGLVGVARRKKQA